MFRDIYKQVGPIASAVLLTSLLLTCDVLIQANGPVLAVLYLPFGLALVNWSYGIYAVLVWVARVRRREWAAGPTIAAGAGLLALQVFVGRSGLGRPGSTGAIIYAVLPFLQTIFILPAGICVGLFLQLLVIGVGRLVRSIGGRPA